MFLEVTVKGRATRIRTENIIIFREHDENDENGGGTDILVANRLTVVWYTAEESYGEIVERMKRLGAI